MSVLSGPLRKLVVARFTADQRLGRPAQVVECCPEQHGLLVRMVERTRRRGMELRVVFAASACQVENGKKRGDCDMVIWSLHHSSRPRRAKQVVVGGSRSVLRE